MQLRVETEKLLHARLSCGEKPRSKRSEGQLRAWVTFTKSFKPEQCKAALILASPEFFFISFLHNWIPTHTQYCVLFLCSRYFCPPRFSTPLVSCLLNFPSSTLGLIYFFDCCFLSWDKLGVISSVYVTSFPGKTSFCLNIRSAFCMEFFFCRFTLIIIHYSSRLLPRQTVHSWI